MGFEGRLGQRDSTWRRWKTKLSRSNERHVGNRLDPSASKTQIVRSNQIQASLVLSAFSGSQPAQAIDRSSRSRCRAILASLVKVPCLAPSPRRPTKGSTARTSSTCSWSAFGDGVVARRCFDHDTSIETIESILLSKGRIRRTLRSNGKGRFHSRCLGRT